METMNWNDVKNGLPINKKSFEQYIVVVCRSHYPTSTYDSCDSPYDENFIMTARYDDKQKIWHLDCDEYLNALIDIDDSSLNEDYVTHWMRLPEFHPTWY